MIPLAVIVSFDSHWSKHIELGAKSEADWEASLEAYTQKYPEEAAEFKGLISLELPTDWDKALPVSSEKKCMVASFEGRGL